MERAGDDPEGRLRSRLSLSVRISNGQLVNAGDSAFTITGKVGDTGAITVTVSAGGKSATGIGRLAGNEGGGMWTGGRLLRLVDGGTPLVVNLSGRKEYPGAHRSKVARY